MGRINLTALQVRKQAINTYKAKADLKGTRPPLPNWVDIVGDIPPAQILTRQQPNQHSLSKVRTRTLPGTKRTQQYATVAASSKKQSGKASRLFAPIKIKYEEDELRHQFFSDHPWELARPRIVLESTGNQYAGADWSTGLLQPGIPLSGESVIQRQLWLLQNVPDVTISQSYDIARQEFYTLRRAEETKRRIAVEEAEHLGAVFHKSANQWALEIENKMYDDWEKWSRAQTLEQVSRNSAMAGETMPAEQEALQETQAFEEEKGQGQLGRPDTFAARQPKQPSMVR